MSQEQQQTTSPYDLISMVREEPWFKVLHDIVCVDVNIPISVFSKNILLDEIVSTVFAYSDAATAAERWAVFLYTHISYDDLVTEVIKTGLFVSSEKVELVILPRAYMAQCLSLEEFKEMYIETKNELVFSLLVLYAFHGVS